MKKPFLLLTGIMSVFTSFAQSIYQDNFDEDIASIAYEGEYTVSLSNNNLLIEGDGTSAAYSPFSYIIHSSGTANSIDLSSNSKFFIKAKGSGNPKVRIDLDDTEGFSTSKAELSVTLSDEYEIYELDYNGGFIDAGYSAACDTNGTTTCPVDSSNIATITMFINAATGAYNGSIEIDWITFGESLEDLPEASEFDIRYNQVGYTKGQSKLINIIGLGTFSNKAYTIYNSSNSIVLSGITGTSNSWSDSGENSVSVDITTIDTEGAYRFVIDEMEITFNVLEDGYASVREEAFKYYYYNRASMALTSQYAGDYARAGGHLDDVVYIHKSAATNQRPTGSTISAPKGWYDAGDYNKYVVNSGISTFTLLAAYEHFDEYFKNTNFNIPENGGNIPDILDETIWNLDWMLAMQDTDGGVYHKLTGLNFSGNVMPSDYNMDRYVVQKSTAASLNFAAVTAVASRIFAEYENVKPGYSSQLLEASKSAYAWAKANPSAYYVQGADLLDDVVTGEYPDTDVTDEFQWAATELYITTNDNTYASDINETELNGGVPAWQKVNTLALVSIAHHSGNLPSNITTIANTQLISIADDLKNTVNTSAMNVAMSGSDFVWGSNGVAGNQIVLLIRAYELTEDASYLDAAYNALDYLFGRNGTGYSFVTGFGDNSPVDPHHRISVADNVGAPVPGMIVGGPHSGQQDVGTNSWECNASLYPSSLPAASYTDSYCSYSTNEITINWNAPFVYSLHALKAIQNKDDSTLSNTNNYNNLFTEKFKVYPNPTLNYINIKSTDNTNNTIVEIFTIKGEKVISTSYDGNETNIDLTNKVSGVYLVKISIGKEVYTTKVVKQ